MTTITLATPHTLFAVTKHRGEQSSILCIYTSFLLQNWYWYQQMHFMDKWITWQRREIKTIWWYPTEKIHDQWVFSPYVECNKLSPSTPGVIISILVRLIAVTHIFICTDTLSLWIFSLPTICLHFISHRRCKYGAHCDDDVVVQVTPSYTDLFQVLWKSTNNKTACRFYLFTQDIYVFLLPLFLSWKQ